MLAPQKKNIRFFSLFRRVQIAIAVQHGDAHPLVSHLPAYLLDDRLMGKPSALRHGHGQFFVAPASEAVAEGMGSAEAFTGLADRREYSCTSIKTEIPSSFKGYLSDQIETTPVLSFLVFDFPCFRL